MPDRHAHGTTTSGGAAATATAYGAEIVHPQGPVDRMLSASAANYPSRIAIHDGSRQLSYQRLDELADRCAAFLATFEERPGMVVAVASLLSADFVIGYYGTLRAGHVAAPVNPYLREEQLAHVLRSSGARVLFADAATAARVESVRDRLPDLCETVLIGPPPAYPKPGARLLSDELAAFANAAPALPAHSPGADDVAALHFTSGTTGAPKTVRLSHRNVTVNAAQVAHAHRLDSGPVTLNHLPTFHPMHMNAAILSGAVQVLCPAPDPVASVELANAHGATHYYSLPVRLTVLASSPALAQCRFETVGIVASGGSALPPAAAHTLHDHFGIPVIQGYGLAETSPLTHSDDPGNWRAGSVGYPVADTECRIVDLTTRRPRPAGEPGEIQVRGPQVMLGYTDELVPSVVDADGWLSTGDVGRLEPDGRLVLVDRIKDVFKRDNWLVSPTAVERVLGAHQAVADCVVVEYPCVPHGAVATAFVVPHGADPDTAPSPAVVAQLTDAVAEINTTLPYYERIEHTELVAALPRSPNGKIPRRELRDRMTGLISALPADRRHFPRSTA